MPELFDKVKGFLLGVDDEDDDEYIYEEEEYDEDPEVKLAPEISRLSPRRGQARGTANIRSISSTSNVVDLHKRTQVNVNLPTDIESARDIIENTREHIITIVNLEGVDSAMAQRIADFLSGSVDALDGNIKRLSHDMFIIAPNGVDINGELSSDISDSLKGSSISLPWLNTAFR